MSSRQSEFPSPDLRRTTTASRWFPRRNGWLARKSWHFHGRDGVHRRVLDPVFEILDARGLEVLLVNARVVKNVPGRKTDVNDAQWLQQLHEHVLLRGSFRPRGGPVPFDMRDVLGVHGDPKPCPVYRMSVHLGLGPLPNTIATFSADLIGLDDRDGDVHGLLGRDLLSHFELHYDGPAGMLDSQRPTSRGTARKREESG